MLPLVGWALGSWGCVGNAILTTARPIGDNVNEVAVGPAFTVAERQGPQRGEVDFSLDDARLPYAEVAFRHGVGDHFDFGAAGNTAGSLRFDAKLGAQLGRWFAIAIDPSVGGNPALLAFRYEVAPLFDVAFAQGLTLTLAPRYSGLVVPGALIHFAGAQLAFEWLATPTFGVQPWFGFQMDFGQPEQAGEVAERLYYFAGGLAAKLRFGAARAAPYGAPPPAGR